LNGALAPPVYQCMEINGLPLHPLVIHAAVIFGPLAAVAAILYAVVPSWRDRMRIPMVVLAVVAGGCIVAAYLTGTNFLGSKPELEQLDQVQTHKDRAWITLWVTLGFTVVALAAAFFHERRGAVRVGVQTLLVVTALATLVSVVLTGDAGARAVWGS
jgi:hypothetical protein